MPCLMQVIALEKETTTKSQWWRQSRTGTCSVILKTSSSLTVVVAAVVICCCCCCWWWWCGWWWLVTTPLCEASSRLWDAWCESASASVGSLAIPVVSLSVPVAAAAECSTSSEVWCCADVSVIALWRWTSNTRRKSGAEPRLRPAERDRDRAVMTRSLYHLHTDAMSKPTNRPLKLNPTHADDVGLGKVRKGNVKSHTRRSSVRWVQRNKADFGMS